MKAKTKKAMSMLLVVTLIAIIAVGGMLAYLTDRDSEANVFTVGDVEIDLTEEFEHGATLTPGVSIDKKVEVANTGKNDAWVWVTVAVPEEFDDETLHIEKVTQGWTWGTAVEKEIKGAKYKEYTALYNAKLAANEKTTYPAMTKVALDTQVDIAPNGDWYLVNNGNVTPIGWNNSNGNPVVYVSAYAIQADTFATVEAAHAAYYAQWGTNGAGDEYADAYVVCDPAVINNGVITLDGDAYISGTQNPFTVEGKGTLYLRNVSVNAADGSAVTVKGTTAKLAIEGDTTLKATENAIDVPAGAKLDLSGKGELTAIGGNGVDSTNGGNGIGGEGAIYIHDLEALTAEGYGVAGFGIGGATKDITIEDTHIDYVKGGYVQPNFINDTKYGKSEPEGGAAIGSMTDGAVITMKNVVVEKADGGSKAAAIGARYWTGVTINIDGCTIKEANGGNASAGIGGSRIPQNPTDAKAVTININDSTVTATGGEYAAGIGSGYDTHCGYPQPLHTINITGNSVIKATGGKYAAGIGTGYHVASLAGKIESSVTVNAVSGEKFYKEAYTQAEDVGFGVVDPTREGKDKSYSIDYKGTIIKLSK